MVAANVDKRTLNGYDQLSAALESFGTAARNVSRQNRFGRSEDFRAFRCAVELLVHSKQSISPFYRRKALLIDLPRLVLRRVLEHCSLVERIALSQSCSTLRVEACSASHLWADFYGTSLALGRHSYLFARSTPAPVHLDMTILEDQVFVEVIASLLPRLESLALQIAPSKLDIDFDLPANGQLPIFNYTVNSRASSRWNYLQHVLSFPAPLLQQLRFYILRSPWNQVLCHLAPDIFAGDPGRLRSCCLNGVLLRYDASYAAFSGLTTLEYSIPFDVSTKDLDDMVGCMSKLNQLALNVPTLVQLDPQRVCRSPIEKVSISMTLSPDMDLSALNYFRGVELFASIKTRTRADLFGVPVQAEIMGLCFAGSVQADVSTGSQSTIIYNSGRRILRVLTHVLWMQPQFCSQLTLLSIHEFQMLLYPARLHLPQLTELCIALATCADYIRGHGQFSETCDSGIHAIETSISSPNLHTLRVSFPSAWKCIMTMLRRRCWCTSGCSLALNDIARFVRRSLHFSSSQLSRLVLTNINNIVDYDLPAALSAIGEVVHDLDFQVELPSHIERLTSVAAKDNPLAEAIGHIQNTNLQWAMLPEDMNVTMDLPFF